MCGDEDEREKIEMVTRIVLSVIEQREVPADPQKKPIVTYIEWVSSNWILFVFVLSLIGILIAYVCFGVSPFHPFKEIAAKQKEYTKKSDQMDYSEKMVKNHLKLGENLLNIGRYKEAKVEYEAALKLEKANIKARMGMYKIRLYERMKTNYAPDVIEKEIQFIIGENGANDPQANMFLGRIFAQGGNSKKARDHYTKVISKHPKVAEARFAMGLLEESEGNIEESLRMYEEAVKLSKWNIMYLNNLASIHFKRKQYQKAIDFYEKVLQLDHEFLAPYDGVAKAYLHMGKIKEAAFYNHGLVSRLGNKELTDLPKNDVFWVYDTLNAQAPAMFHDLPGKQIYAIYSLSLIWHLSGDKSVAEPYIKKAQKIECAYRYSIKNVIEKDLDDLQKAQPAQKKAIDEFWKTTLESILQQ